MDDLGSAIVPRETTEWRIIGLAVAAGIVGAFQIGKAAIALPALRADLGLGLAAAGWILSVFNLIGVLAGMPLGAVIGRLGDRRMLLAGLALIAAASLFGAMAPGAALLLATRIVEGLGFLVIVIAAPTLIARAPLIALATAAMFAAALGIFLWAPPLWASYALYLAFATLGGMLPASVLGAAPAHAPAPHLVPATNGLLVQGSNLGQVIGPPAIGALAAAWGWGWSPLLLAPAAAGALALAALLRRQEGARP